MRTTLKCAICGQQKPRAEVKRYKLGLGRWGQECDGCHKILEDAAHRDHAGKDEDYQT